MNTCEAEKKRLSRASSRLAVERAIDRSRMGKRYTWEQLAGLDEKQEAAESGVESTPRVLTGRPNDRS